MHIHSRLLRASSGASLADATGFVAQAVQHINDTHGAGLGVGVQVGGDGLLIGVTGTYERLGELEALRDALAEDEAYQSLVASGQGLFEATVQDTIWKSRLEPDEPQRYALVSSARMMLTSIAEATTFAAEVCTTVNDILGRKTGLVTAVTGDRSRLLWLGYVASLDQVEEDNETLEGSPAYIDLFKRSEGLIVANSLEQNIWQRINE